ncbi:MAG TPA: GNAT family N-acetyltransferase [Gemmatimonadales bacterium]|nr:GNAT family N-acetyltransferase [Gemmatimonadales bacterium]
MASVDVERTWLEMRQRPAHAPTVAPPGVRLQRATPCPPGFYRFLYGEVGRAFKWVDRLGWPDDRLAAHLADPTVAVWVALEGPVPLGYFELVRHPDASVEIAYFGLMPWAIGRGLGRWLLEAAIAEAWRDGPTRIWLHTCTLDHPAALPNYLGRGFTVTHREQIVQEVPG